MFSTCKVKNIDSSTGTYCGQELIVDQVYQIEDAERIKWSTDNNVISAITSDKLQVGNGTDWYTLYSDQIDCLKNSLPESVEILEEHTKTGGHFKSEGFELGPDIITDSIGWKEKEFSFSIPRTIMSAHIHGRSENDGDVIELYVATGTVIGSITSDVAVDDDIINVSQTVIDNTKIGYRLSLYNGVDLQCFKYIKSIDTENLTVIMEEKATQIFLASSPTYVKQTIVMAENIHIEDSDVLDIGLSKVGGSYLPAETKILARYYNSTTTAKTFHFKMEFLY